MKKIYLAFAVLLFGALSMSAQVNVTMRVDMSTQMNVDTVSVAGSFQAAAGFPNDWTPGDTELADPDMDGVYEVTVSIPSGSYEYKFLNGTAWGTDEGVPGACAVNGNRGMTIGANDTTLDIVCFGQCGPCPVSQDTFTVILEVDMSNVAVPSDTASVAGDFQASVVGESWSNWTPGQISMLDADNDSVYTVSFRLLEGTYGYKFLRGGAWGTDEGVPSACEVSGNRELVLQSDTAIRYCFGTCDEVCVPPLPAVNVTFRVSMIDEIPSANGIFVAGDFQDPAWVKDTDQMTQDVNDPDVYSFTTMIVPGEYQFKYFNGNAGDPDGETADFAAGGCGIANAVGGFNRLLAIEGLMQDTVLPIFKFNTCDEVTVGIEDDLNNGRAFTISPNPFSGFTNVSFSNPEGLSYTVEVMNMGGQIVQRINELRQDNFRLEANDLPAGMYLISLTNKAGERYTAKAIVK